MRLIEMTDKFTLEALERSTKECLTAQQVSDILKVSKKSFMKAAKTEPDKLGFPIIQIGQRIIVPREPFLKFIHGKEKNDD